MKQTDPEPRIIRTGGFMSLLLFSSMCMGADFPQRVDSADRSAREGLGRSEVALFKTKTGPGKEAAADFFLKRFGQSQTPITTAGPSSRIRKQERLYVIGQGWRLKVYKDGSKVRYENSAATARNLNIAKPVSQKMALQQLEMLGRKFIDEHLKGVINLAPNEALAPYLTEYEISGGGATAPDARPEEEKVLANTVVFTRTIDGIPVIGAGSKVAATFANDGSPIGFDFDWPVYEPAGKKQKVLDRPNIQKRHQQLSPVNLQAPNVKVPRFECGYYDPGVTKREVVSPVQAGCVAQSVVHQIVDSAVNSSDPNSGHILHASALPIPVGVVVEPDRRWRQVGKLLGSETPRAGSAQAGTPPPPPANVR